MGSILRNRVLMVVGACVIGGSIYWALYLASAPQTARVDSFFAIWGGAAVTGIVGSVFVLYGLLSGRKDT